MTGVSRLLAEALRAVRASRITSLVSLVTMAALMVAVLRTAGGAAAQREQVLAQFNDVSARVITLRVAPEYGLLNRGFVADLAHMEPVSEVIALGPAHDVTAAALPGGTKVAARNAFGYAGGEPLFASRAEGEPVAHLGAQTASKLGLGTSRGSVRWEDGADYLIGDDLPELGLLRDVADPILVDDSAMQEAVQVWILVRSPQDVGPMAALVRKLTDEAPRDKVTIETSQALADLRTAVDGEMVRSQRGLLLGLLGASALLTGLSGFGLVLQRRRDFGRRRALGATRLWLVNHVVLLVVIPAVFGIVLGVAVAWIWGRSTGAPPVPLGFIVPAAVALLVSAVVGSLVPAVVASRRDPVAELRVP